MLAKLTIVSVAILVLAIPVILQQPCSKSLSQSPALFGFRLGMSIDEVRSSLGPTIKFWKKPPKNGEGSFFQNFVEEPAPSNLNGIRALYVRFFDSKVYQVEIFYEDKDKPTDLKSFADQLSTEFGLPAEAWTIKNGQAAMDCGDFSLDADTILNRHIELTDDAALSEFNKKKQQEKGKKKKGN